MYEYRITAINTWTGPTPKSRELLYNMFYGIIYSLSVGEEAMKIAQWTAKIVGAAAIVAAASGSLKWFEHKMLDGVEPRTRK